MTTRAEIEARFGLPVPEILDEATFAQAQELLTQLSSALFPGGVVPPELLTWGEAMTSGAKALGGQTVEEKLRAAETRFATLVQQIPAVTFMAVLGEGENEVYVSPHVEQMLGYSQEEWLSDPFLWYTRLHPDDRELWNEEFADGCRRGGPFRAECRFLARDGHVVWVHGEARLVKDQHGRLQFLQGVAFDITESKKAQAALLEHAVRTAKIQEELEIARRVQTSILPKEPRLDGLEIAAAMVPADEVGGDYYDVRAVRDGGWVTIGDVSGHGLDAGLVMLMVQSAASAIALAHPGTLPSELVTLLNEVMFDNVSRRLERSEYVTLSVLRYTRNGHIVYAGGHQDIVVYRARERRVERVQTPGPWVGVRRDLGTITVDHEFDLADGDVMVLFTDGVIEAANADGELFEMSRLCAVVEKHHDESPTQIRDAIVRSVGAWAHRQDDDVTVLVARYAAAGNA